MIMNDFQIILDKELQKEKASKYPDHVLRVAEQVRKCRTNAMPGHLYSCPEDHFSIFLRNSCNNRSCPVCQGAKRKEWKEMMEDMIVESPHYHLVFKLPSYCNVHILKRYKEFINILFESSLETIMKILKLSQYEQSTPGFVSVLHTHGEENQLHPHVHIMMNSTGISRGENKLISYNNQLFDIEKYQSLYLTIIKKKLLKLHNTYPEMGEIFLREVIRQQTQEIFISKEYASAKPLIEYLSKTIKGTSIQLNRMELEEDDIVRYREKETERKIPGEEFIRRYLLHILPPKLKSVRYFGYYSSSSRKKLGIVKLLNEEKESNLEKYDDPNELLEKKDYELDRILIPYKICPVCQKAMILEEKVDAFGYPDKLSRKFGPDPPIEDLFRKLVA